MWVRVALHRNGQLTTASPTLHVSVLAVTLLAGALMSRMLVSAAARARKAVKALSQMMITFSDVSPLKPRRKSTLSVLNQVRQAGVLGIDVGGTLAKVVVAEPSSADSAGLPEFFGEDGNDGQPAGRTHRNMDMLLRQRASSVARGAPRQERKLQFVSGASEDLYSFMDRVQASPQMMQRLGSFASPSPRGARARYRFGSGGSRQGGSRSEGCEPDEGGGTSIGGPGGDEPRRVAATGGGAHRLKESMLQIFNLELVPVKEMESVIGGTLACACIRSRKRLNPDWHTSLDASPILNLNPGMLALHALRPKGELFTVVDADSARLASFGASEPVDHLLDAYATDSSVRLSGGSDHPNWSFYRTPQLSPQLSPAKDSSL